MRIPSSKPLRIILLGTTVLWDVFACDAARSSASDEPAHGIVVKRGDTVVVTRSRRYCWFPNVSRLSTGEIIVGFLMSPDEVNPEGEFTAFCVSRDGGRRWGPRVTAGEGFQDSAIDRVPRPDGKLMRLGFWLLPNPPGQTKELDAVMIEVSQGGHRVTQRNDIHVSLPQPVVSLPVKLFGHNLPDGGQITAAPGVEFDGSILDSLHGSLLATMTGRFEGDRFERDILVESRDGGKSWRYLSTIAQVQKKVWPGAGDEGVDELTMVRLADNRLFCIMRTGDDGLMYQTSSADDGKTWEKPVSSGAKGVDPHLRLLGDGILACSYGRPGPVTVMFSLDGTGRTWSNHTVISEESGQSGTGDKITRRKSTCYSDVIEVAPGRLLVVYDHVPQGWDPIPKEDTESFNTIYGTFLEVSKQ